MKKRINILKFIFIAIILQSHTSFLYGTSIINTASNNSQLLQYTIPFMLKEENLETLITIENPHFKSFVTYIIANALEQETNNISDGLLKCYKQLCANNNTFLARDLIDVLPNLIIQLNQMKTKAPRPSSLSPVVGPEACNLSIVENLLNEILRNLTACCNNAAIDFASTFSSIQDIKNTLTTCCEDIFSDFQQTWTILNADFNGTFSLLEELDGDLNNCCSTMLSILVIIQSELATLENTITVIEDDINNVQTLINNSQTIFSQIAAIFSPCCNTIDGINNTANHVSCLAACIAPICEPEC